MMSRSQRSGLFVVVAALLACAVVMQARIDPLRHQFEPKVANVNSAAAALPVEFALGAATGFREAIAGLLWVRTDEFFHEGNYDAIVPMVRIITWLDPHNTDVYQTGAWHLDYNFTDAAQRSDRRYIPLAIALLKEGIANNPDDTTMYADLAFTHYFRKIGDFPSSVEWFEKGQALRAKHPDDWDVTAVGHGLAHAYLATGQIDKAIAEWQICVDEHNRRYQKDHKDTIDYSGMLSARKNLKETILRKKWRSIMTKPPIDSEFDCTVTRIAPMVLMINGHAHFIGSKDFVLETGAHQWIDADGCRIDARLQDANYKYPREESLTLGSSVSHDATIMQDSFSVQKGKFSKKIDMSADHGGSQPIYSFTAPKYTLTLWFNPGSEMDNPPFVADRIGWKGEGLTDKRYLDTTGELPGTNNSRMPETRMLKKTIVLTRDDIMGAGIKEFH